MKFLTDVGVGKKVEEFLSQAGHDCKAVRDIDTKMNDLKILNLARDEHRIVITMDKDFGELVYNSGFTSHGVILLRLESMNGEEKKEVVKYILENFSDKLTGSFCVYRKGRFRIRHK